MGHLLTGGGCGGGATADVNADSSPQPRSTCFRQSGRPRHWATRGAWRLKFDLEPETNLVVCSILWRDERLWTVLEALRRYNYLPVSSRERMEKVDFAERELAASGDCEREALSERREAGRKSLLRHPSNGASAAATSLLSHAPSAPSPSPTAAAAAAPTVFVRRSWLLRMRRRRCAQK